jgi:ribokinase
MFGNYHLLPLIFCFTSYTSFLSKSIVKIEKFSINLGLSTKFGLYCNRLLQCCKDKYLKIYHNALEIGQMSDIEVIGLGALNMDYIYLADAATADSETASGAGQEYQEANLKPLGAFPGGSAANTVYGLARLGVKTGVIGAVGDDADGQKLLEDFRKAGVNNEGIKVKLGAKTGGATCVVDRLNSRSIHVSPGANSRLTMNDVDRDYVNRADILHISSFVDDAQFDILLKLVKKLAPPVRISFSPGELYAARGLQTLTPILARTHVLFINGKEIRLLTGDVDFDSGADSCIEAGCHIVVVTLGQGVAYKNTMAVSYIRTADNEYLVEPPDRNPIDARDSIGAGDAFAAGFLFGLLNERPLKECGNLGDTVARFSLRETGARAGLPSRNQLARRYRELYHREL